MKQHLSVVCLLASLLVACSPGGIGLTPLPPPVDIPGYLGELDGFWRYSAALGPFHVIGQALIEIPDYLLGSDFPYLQRPFAKEVAFADHLSMVRILGGVHIAGETDPHAHLKGPANDLAFRDESGEIQYRMDLLQARLAPYIANGYGAANLTLVMDNVPFCFPETPEIGSSLGQSAPPSDPHEWYDFIRAVAEELVHIFGEIEANSLRFRVGTENGGWERFGGTHTQYLWHYDATAAAIKDVLPGAQVGLYNISGASVHGIPRHNVNAFAVAEHVLTQPNLVSGLTGTPFDFLSFSRYLAPGRDLEASAVGLAAVWLEFERLFPELTGIPREIHEYGLNTFHPHDGELVTSEPGAYGAAQTLHFMVRLRELGLDRMWHWNPYSIIRDGRAQLQHLFNGQAWVYTVLDHMKGGHAYLLETETALARGTQHLALASVTGDQSIILASAFHPDFSVSGQESLQIDVPIELMEIDPSAVSYVILNRQTDVHERIRNDLEAAELLALGYLDHPYRIGSIREMARRVDGNTRQAEVFIGNNWSTYTQMWQESLTGRPLTPDVATIDVIDGVGYSIAVHVSPPSIIALVIQ